MLPNLTPDMDLAARLFDALRDATRDGEGVTREAYGRGERIAHQLVRDAAEELGLLIPADIDCACVEINLSIEEINSSFALNCDEFIS